MRAGDIIRKTNEMKAAVKPEDSLSQTLSLTDSVINKRYLLFLTNAGQYKLQPVQSSVLAVEAGKHARIFHLKKFTYDPDENFLSKLITVINVAYALKGTIMTMIHSSGDCIDFYIGIIAKENKSVTGEKDREALLNAFEGTISGNFTGSDIGERIVGSAADNLSKYLDGNAICAVSVVPSLRGNGRGSIDAYVQGIENLADALKGRKYTLLTIADPVSTQDISEIRHGYENIHNYLAPLYRIVETKGVSESISLSRTDTESYVKGITEGISRTQSKSESVNYTNGFNLGLNFIVSAGFNHSKGSGSSTTEAASEASSRSEQTGKTKSTATGTGHTSSDSTQISIENRIIKSMMDKLEKNIQRIDECEGYGAFNSATYVIADEKETALNAAGNFVSLMKGESSSAQSSAINCWEKGKSKDFSALLSYLQHFSHPTFNVSQSISVSTSVMVSGSELTVQLGLPKKSVNGLAVLPMYPFGRNVRMDSEDTFELGQHVFMGVEEARTVKLDTNSLTAHTFITGSTGTGKSNVIYGMLNKLDGKGIHFMVIEPAKGEYKNVFGSRADVHVYGTNEKKTELLRVNPFAFNSDVHVLEHIDRLIDVFNVCWPMYAAMPAVLKEAVEEAYSLCGWDMDTSENRYGRPAYPTFSDLERALQTVIDRSAYDNEVKSNYKGALLTRVRSLTNGMNRKLFGSDEIPEEQLFDSNVIIDLSRVGSAETKSLLMGIMIIRLQEYRMSGGDINSGLRHLTVIEEAHNLLKKTSSEQSPEGSNVAGKAVEMMANAIAEMRTYGEGFIIADQAPGLMDTAVIRNTNTKIIFRTPEYNDRCLVGRAACLNDGQIDELARLPLGVCAVYQNNWAEPVLCKAEKQEMAGHFIYQKGEATENGDSKEIQQELIKWVLMSRTDGVLTPDYEKIDSGVNKLQLTAMRKQRIKQYLAADDENRGNAWAGYEFRELANLVVDILGCRERIKYAFEGAASADSIQQEIDRIVMNHFKRDIEKTLYLEVCHCIMKVFSEGGDKALRKYYEWDYQVRNKLG